MKKEMMNITFGFHSISLSMGFTLQTINSTAWGGRCWNLAGKWRSWELWTWRVLPSSMYLILTLKNKFSSFGGVSTTWTLHIVGEHNRISIHLINCKKFLFVCFCICTCKKKFTVKYWILCGHMHMCMCDHFIFHLVI